MWYSEIIYSLYFIVKLQDASLYLLLTKHEKLLKPGIVNNSSLWIIVSQGFRSIFKMYFNIWRLSDLSNKRWLIDPLGKKLSFLFAQMPTNLLILFRLVYVCEIDISRYLQYLPEHISH